MATKVKDTPVLRGKDAERFTRIIKENETKRVSAEEYNQAMAAFKKVRIFNSMKDYQEYHAGKTGV